MASSQTPSRGMVVVAHADDAEWGCSGTVALWCRRGMRVTYVVCTDGGKGSDEPEMTSERLAQIRRGEQLAAAKVLGVEEVVFLGYEDAMLQPDLELRRDIVRQIRKFKPAILIAQYPGRCLKDSEYMDHPDHIAAGEATLSAVFPASRDRLTFPELLEEGLEPHRVGEVLVMDWNDAADTWIDVTDTIAIAVEALEQHKSQGTPGVVEKHLRRERAKIGEPRNMAYAESFKSYRLD